MQILVCRPPATAKDGKEASRLDVIRFVIDKEVSSYVSLSQSVLNIPQEGIDNFACAWTKHPESGTPLLCVAGNSGKIKILDVVKGEWQRVMSLTHIA